MADQAELVVETKESVAFKLALELRGCIGTNDFDEGYKNKFLDLYAECLEATNGYRSSE